MVDINALGTVLKYVRTYGWYKRRVERIFGESYQNTRFPDTTVSNQ